MQNFPFIDVLAYSQFDKGLVAFDHSCKATKDIVESSKSYNYTVTYTTLLNSIDSYLTSFQNAYEKNEVANKEFNKAKYYNSTFISYEQSFLNNYDKYYKFINDNAGYNIEEAYQKCSSLYMDAKKAVIAYFGNKYNDIIKSIPEYDSTYDSSYEINYSIKSNNAKLTLPEPTKKINLATNSLVTDLSINDIESMIEFNYFIQNINFVCYNLQTVLSGIQGYFNSTKNIQDNMWMFNTLDASVEGIITQYDYGLNGYWGFTSIPSNFTTDAYNAIEDQFKNLSGFFNYAASPLPLVDIIDNCFEIYNSGNQTINQYLGR